MDLSFKDTATTVEFLARRRPALAHIIKAFAPLYDARERLVPELEEMLREKGVTLAPFQKTGVPILAAFSPQGLAGIIRRSAEKMLPPLLEQPAIASARDALENFFLADVEENDPREELLLGMISGSNAANARIAAKIGLAPEVLDFAANFALSPVLHALAALVPKNDGEYPFDAEGAWSEGYCPVCGGYPSIGWLDKANFDEKNAFLAGGGGKKHLHCPNCGTNWKFRRGVCAACGNEGNGAIEILRAEGQPAERLDWCAKCRAYCPIIDLREMSLAPDMDIMALGMIHLDMVAAEKKLLPIRPSFWNSF